MDPRHIDAIKDLELLDFLFVLWQPMFFDKCKGISVLLFENGILAVVFHFADYCNIAV
jgi:hypothetical protein